jgi:hypothetical protein
VFIMAAVAKSPVATAFTQVILSAPSEELRNLWIMAMSIAGVTRSFRFWARKEV